MVMILVSIGIALVSFFNILIAIFVAENIEPYDPILWVCVALILNSLLIYLIARQRGNKRKSMEMDRGDKRGGKK